MSNVFLKCRFYIHGFEWMEHEGVCHIYRELQSRANVSNLPTEYRTGRHFNEVNCVINMCIKVGNMKN